jgi:hypothetical protein
VRARSNADLVGVVVGVGVGAGGGIGSGAGADEDLEAAVLGPRHGAGRITTDRPPPQSVSQSSALLAGRARAFLESGAEQDGSGWPLCSFCAAFACGGLACSLAAGACAPLHGVFIFLEEPPSSSGPPLLFPLLPVRFFI